MQNAGTVVVHISLLYRNLIIFFLLSLFVILFFYFLFYFFIFLFIYLFILIFLCCKNPTHVSSLGGVPSIMD